MSKRFCLSLSESFSHRIGVEEASCVVFEHCHSYQEDWGLVVSKMERRREFAKEIFSFGLRYEWLCYLGDDVVC